jgi:hypothetical protein
MTQHVQLVGQEMRVKASSSRLKENTCLDGRRDEIDEEMSMR